jgi:oligopeptide/dipeptide ABC transporter ATP-binding protein
MYRGRILEAGRTDALFRNPAHPYTRALLSAIPIPDPDARPQRIAWNPDEIDLTLPLRDIEEGHRAAV